MWLADPMVSTARATISHRLRRCRPYARWRHLLRSRKQVRRGHFWYWIRAQLDMATTRLCRSCLHVGWRMQSLSSVRYLVIETQGVGLADSIVSQFLTCLGEIHAGLRFINPSLEDPARVSRRQISQLAFGPTSKRIRLPRRQSSRDREGQRNMVSPRDIQKTHRMWTRLGTMPYERCFRERDPTSYHLSMKVCSATQSSSFKQKHLCSSEEHPVDLVNSSCAIQ